jgi:hypothetical protein
MLEERFLQGANLASVCAIRQSTAHELMQVDALQ